MDLVTRRALSVGGEENELATNRVAAIVCGRLSEGVKIGFEPWPFGIVADGDIHTHSPDCQDSRNSHEPLRSHRFARESKVKRRLIMPPDVVKEGTNSSLAALGRR